MVAPIINEPTQSDREQSSKQKSRNLDSSHFVVLPCSTCHFQTLSRFLCLSALSYQIENEFIASIVIKTISKLEIKGNFLNTIKGIHKEPKASIILNSKSLRAFPPRSATGQGCPLFPLLFTVLPGH